HAPVVHREQGAIGHGGAVNVAAEVVEDLLGTVCDGLGEYDPSLLPRNGGECRAWDGAPRQGEEASAEELAERVNGREEAALAARQRSPRPTVGREAAGRDEHVDVRVPRERTRPGVQDGERADAGA